MVLLGILERAVEIGRSQMFLLTASENRPPFFCIRDAHEAAPALKGI